MKKHISLIIDLFFLTRPVVIVPVWGFSAFGVYCINRCFFTQLDLSQYAVMAIYSLSAASVYAFNQIADYDVDKRNGGFPLLVSGGIPTSAAWACSVICGVTSIIVPLLMGYGMVSILSITTIVIGYLYSFKPFYLSGRPFFDFLTNGVEAGLAICVGWIVAGGSLPSSSPLLYVSALPYFLMMCAGSISSTLPDMGGDREGGKITTAVRYGGRVAHCLALGLLVMVVPAAVFGTMDFLALSCAIIIIPTYIPYLVNGDKSINTELTYKVGGAVVMVAAGLVMPVLFPAGVIVFLGTWVYFRVRHGVAYPSLKSNSKSFKAVGDGRRATARVAPTAPRNAPIDEPPRQCPPTKGGGGALFENKRPDGAKNGTSICISLLILLIPSYISAFQIPTNHRILIDTVINEILECRFDNAITLTDKAYQSDNKNITATMLHLAALGMRDVDFDNTIDALAFTGSFNRALETINNYEKLNGIDSYSSTLRGFTLAINASFHIKNKSYFSAAGTGLDAIKIMNEARALDSSNTEVNFFLGLYGYALSELKKKMWWALFWHPGDKAGGIGLLEEGAKTAIITGDAAALALCDIYIKEKTHLRARDVIYSVRRRRPRSRFVLWAEAKYCEEERMYTQAARAYGKLADSYEAETYGRYNAANTRNKQARMYDKAREYELANSVGRRLVERYNKDSGDDKRIAAIVRDTEKLLERLSK